MITNTLSFIYPIIRSNWAYLTVLEKKIKKYFLKAKAFHRLPYTLSGFNIYSDKKNFSIVCKTPIDSANSQSDKNIKTLLLEAKNISKFYASHTALDDVSISIEKGSIFGLLGPNGAGKTSLIRIITQITAADKGQVLFKGQKLEREHITQMGYLPEERGLYKKMRVGEQLLYLAQLKGMDKKEARTKINNWLDKFEIADWAKKNIEELSKGMQQKVQFIATVLHEPELIILDEPFSGFDPINTNLIKDEILQLRERGSTIIFSTHRMESVETLCDDIALIHHSKKVLGGKKSEIKETYKSNTYWLETSMPIGLSTEGCEIIDSEEQEKLVRSKVHIANGDTNQLLSQLIQQGNTIHSLKENIPSMDEIFISVVGKSVAEAALEG